MKILINILMLWLVSLGLTGCGGGSSSSSTPKKVPVNPQNVPKAQVKNSTKQSSLSTAKVETQKTVNPEVKKKKPVPAKTSVDTNNEGPLKKSKTLVKPPKKTVKPPSEEPVKKPVHKNTPPVIISKINCGFQASRQFELGLETVAKDQAFTHLTAHEGLYRLVLNTTKTDLDFKVLAQGKFILLDDTNTPLDKDRFEVVVFKEGFISLQLLPGAEQARTLMFDAEHKVEYTLTDKEVQLARQGALNTCGTLDTVQLKRNVEQGNVVIGKEVHQYQLSLPMTVSHSELKQSLAKRLDACNQSIPVQLYNEEARVEVLEHQQGTYRIKTKDETALTDLKLTAAFLAAAKKPDQHYNLSTGEGTEDDWALAFFGNANAYSTLEMRFEDSIAKDHWDATACNLSLIDLEVIVETALKKVNHYLLSVPIKLENMTLPSLKQRFSLIDQIELEPVLAEELSTEKTIKPFTEKPIEQASLLESPVHVDWAYIYILKHPVTRVNLTLTDYAKAIITDQHVQVKWHLNPPELDWLKYLNEKSWTKPEAREKVSMSWLEEVTKETPAQQAWQPFKLTNKDTALSQSITFQKPKQLLLLKTEYGDLPQQHFIEGIYNPSEKKHNSE